MPKPLQLLHYYLLDIKHVLRRMVSFAYVTYIYSMAKYSGSGTEGYICRDAILEIIIPSKKDSEHSLFTSVVKFLSKLEQKSKKCCRKKEPFSQLRAKIDQKSIYVLR